MTAVTALIAFALWTLLLVVLVVGYRIAVVLTGQRPANAWPRGQVATQDAPLVTRMSHAHLNCLESLPVFAALVLGALALGRLPAIDPLAPWVLGLRLAQSGVHLIGVGPLLVTLRAALFGGQVALLIWMAGLLLR